MNIVLAMCKRISRVIKFLLTSGGANQKSVITLC